MKETATSLINRSLPLNPWLFFLFFLISSILLSYFAFSNKIQLWIGCLGIGIPFITAFKIVCDEKNLFKKSTNFDKTLFDPPITIWLLLIFLLLLTRFYHLTTLPDWPLADEAKVGLLGIGQSHQWHWNLLWAEDRLEPMVFWIMGLYFKIIEPSFFSLRLLPALFSIAVPLAGYWAARQYFSKSTSFLFCWLMSFSFWELTLSRFLSTVMLVPLFECLCFALLGMFINQIGQNYGRKHLFLLSLLAGIGFYTWTNWISIWLPIAAILFMIFYFNKAKNKKFFVVFLAVTILTIWPLVLARLSPDGMSHIRDVGGFPTLKPLFLYLRGLFWDGIISFPFGSNWGGFFNPLLDALILMGVLYLFQTAKKHFMFSIMLCLFPPILLGAFTKSVELYRILPLFPFLTLFAALGIRSLIPDNYNSRSLSFVVFCLLVSFGLDAYNFIFHYSNTLLSPPRQQWRSVEYLNAYQALKQWSEQNGPIDVFTEWNPDYDDKTLNITVYPFNALENSKIAQNQVSWAAFLIDMDYTPFLKKCFPHVISHLLNPNLSPNDLHHLLGIFLIPTTDIPLSVLNQWIKTHQACEQIAFSIKNKKPSEHWAVYEKAFSDLAIEQTHDRFLTSILWERAASFPLMDGNFQSTALDLQKAIQDGYPVPHLRQNLKLAVLLSNSSVQNIQKP